MIRVNENFSLLQGSYLFAEVNRRVREYQAAHPDKKVIRMGIGDVTEPLTPTVIRSLSDGVKEMSARESFKGYSPDQGYDFLREAICRTDFVSRGVPMDITEIFVSTGAKEDTANIQELFGQDIRIAIPDPVYPVYVDSNVMAGRSGPFVDGRYKNFIYLECSAENQFKPSLPSQPVDLIYLCFPNNPTGQVLTKAELQAWVEYARASKALILFDAAYEAFIRDPSIPRSIYEIEGAREVAIEFRSLSKTAGFTGTRCAYTVVPKECAAFDSAGSKVLLNPLWARRQGTKFNGVAYIIQKGAAAVYTPEGQKEARDLIDFYLGNARIARDVLTKLGISCTGGDNSPYIWLKTPGKLSSWDFFDKLLAECQVVGTPGSGFGRNGEGYFRLSSFNSRENVKVAMERFSGLKV